MRWLVGMVLGGVVVWAPIVSAQSQHPSEFFMEEFTFGLLGGLVGGPTVELVYVSTLCREVSAQDEEMQKRLQELCQGLGFLVMQIVVYGVTLPLGTSFGIILAGSLRGIASTPADWIFTYIFAMMGSWTGWLNAAGILKVMDFLMLNLGWDLSGYVESIYTFTRVALPILYAAFLGTMEFNIRIQPQSFVPQRAAASWRVPLFLWRF